MKDDRVAKLAGWFVPGPTAPSPLHRLVDVEDALQSEAIRVASPELDTATCRFLVGERRIDALDERVGVEELLQGLRLPSMRRDAFNAEAHLEQQPGRRRVGHAQPGAEEQPRPAQVDAVLAVQGMVPEPAVGEEDEEAVGVQRDLHLTAGDEELVLDSGTDLDRVYGRAGTRADVDANGGATVELCFVGYQRRRGCGAGNHHLGAPGVVTGR